MENLKSDPKEEDRSFSLCLNQCWASAYLFLLNFCSPVDFWFDGMRGVVIDLVMFDTQVSHSLLELPDTRERR